MPIDEESVNDDERQDDAREFWGMVAFEATFWALLLLAAWLFSTGLERTLAFAGAVAITVVAVSLRLWRMMGR